MTSDSLKTPLEGLKVLDFSWVFAGPMVTRILGQHGATVVRVESSLVPDTVRTYVPNAGGIPGLNRNGLFAAFNDDKLSIDLDLNKPAHLEICRRLVGWADVVVENFSPGQMKKWGLSYEDLARIKPDIIMGSLTGQGQTGPYSRLAVYGLDLAALIGFEGFIGWGDRGPCVLNLPLTDYIIPYYAIAAIMGALDHRDRTGQGQYIDVCQMETGSIFLSAPILDYQMGKPVEYLVGNRSKWASPHGTYRCRGSDRWCALGVFTEGQWRAFCQTIGDLGWSQEARFDSITARKQNEDELDSLIEAWTVTQVAEDAVSRLQSVRVPAGVMATGEDLHRDPQLRHRRHFKKLHHPEIGDYSAEACSWRFSLTRNEPRMPAPCLGQHTEYVLREILKLSDAEITRFITQG